MTIKKGDIYMGPAGSEVKISAFGRVLQVSDTILSREERTASGRLVRDIIASKKKIKLVYETIDGDVLIQFLNFYETFDELNVWIYHDDVVGTPTEPSSFCDPYVVLMQPIDRTRVLLLANGLWSGVTIEMNEV